MKLIVVFVVQRHLMVTTESWHEITTESFFVTCRVYRVWRCHHRGALSASNGNRRTWPLAPGRKSTISLEHLATSRNSG